MENSSDLDIIIFTLEGCEPCKILKQYLNQKGYEYRSVEVVEEIPLDTFNKIYPNASGFPHIIVNNEPVFDLIMYLESGLEI